MDVQGATDAVDCLLVNFSELKKRRLLKAPVLYSISSKMPFQAIAVLMVALAGVKRLVARCGLWL